MSLTNNDVNFSEPPVKQLFLELSMYFCERFTSSATLQRFNEKKSVFEVCFILCHIECKQGTKGDNNKGI